MQHNHFDEIKETQSDLAIRTFICKHCEYSCNTREAIWKHKERKLSSVIEEMKKQIKDQLRVIEHLKSRNKDLEERSSSSISRISSLINYTRRR